MERSELISSIEKLLTRTSTELPEDITSALEKALTCEPEDSVARDTLEIITKSARLSFEDKLPVCQDTGTVLAIVKAKPSTDLAMIGDSLTQALKNISPTGILRHNCVDPVTGINSGDNTGVRVPQVHFVPHDGPTRIFLMLKGGGSENVSTQYSLPDESISAGRDLEGVRRCLLDAVNKAQGKGCAPGILGVCIGSDRAGGYLIAKEQLFRHLDDTNPDEELGKLEKRIVEEANSLGIGPMGLGGNTTLLGAKMTAAGRHPACYFVTVSYSCWATRRYGIELNDQGGIEKWL